MARPSREDLAAARNRTIPDVLPPPDAPLRVLFCGINPSLYSAATGWHFARPHAVIGPQPAPPPASRPARGCGSSPTPAA